MKLGFHGNGMIPYSLNGATLIHLNHSKKLLTGYLLLHRYDPSSTKKDEKNNKLSEVVEFLYAYSMKFDFLRDL